MALAQHTSKARRIGVVLVNTGSPDEPSPEAVKRYLARFLMDPQIAPMNRIVWWVLLHAVILRRRAPLLAERYKRIWTDGGSPLIVAHRSISNALNVYYKDRNLDVHVRFAMSYSDPTPEDVLKEMRNLRCERVVVLPLYPQSAYSTTGAVRRAVSNAIEGSSDDVVLIDNYHDNPAYIDAIATSVIKAGFQARHDDHILFTFHSIPLKDIEAGDTYDLQVSASCAAIVEKLGLSQDRWSIGFQSRFDKKRAWLSPFTRQILKDNASRLSGRLFMVCPNFSVDCLETLYEIGIESRAAYIRDRRSAGREACDDSYVLVPCLNASQDQIDVLVDVLKPYVEI